MNHFVKDLCVTRVPTGGHRSSQQYIIMSSHMCSSGAIEVKYIRTVMSRM